MSSDIIDVEVNVVSSPEMSRPGSEDRPSVHSPQPSTQINPVGVDHVDPQKSVGAVGQINSTSVNISVHPAQPPHPYHHLTHQLSNHHHSSNSAESNQSSPSSKSAKSDPKKTTTPSSGYTSFSISSILSRNEPKKDVAYPSLPLLPLHHIPEDLHNSTMFSR